MASDSLNKLALKVSIVCTISFGFYSTTSIGLVLELELVLLTKSAMERLGFISLGAALRFITFFPS
jgi:hypothetical protein